MEERGGRGTTSSRTTTGGAPELRQSKSACAGDAVLSSSNWGTVPMRDDVVYWYLIQLPLHSSAYTSLVDSALDAIEDSIS